MVKTLGLYASVVLLIVVAFGAVGTYLWGEYFLLAQKVGKVEYRVLYEEKSPLVEQQMLRELLEYAEKAEWKSVGLVCAHDPEFCGGEELYETKFLTQKIVVRVLYTPHGTARGHHCLLCPVAFKEEILLPWQAEKEGPAYGQIHTYTLVLVTTNGSLFLTHSEFAETDTLSRASYAIVDDYKPIVKKIFLKAKNSAGDFHI